MLDVLKNMAESIKNFFKRDWTMSEKILLILCCVMIGMIKGFFLAPVKRGMVFGSNNGNVYNQLEDEDWLDEED